MESYNNLTISSSNALGLGGFVLLMVLAGVFALAYAFDPSDNRAEALPALHETAAVFGFLLLPVAGYFAAIVKTHMYHPRYVIPLLVGYALLFGLAAAHLFGRSAVNALAVTGILLAVFLANGVLYARHQPLPNEGCPVAPSSGPLRNLPIVMPTGLEYIRCDFYASPEMKSRMVFVADPILSLRYLDTDLSDKYLVGTKDLLGVHVVPFADFQSAHRQFLLNGLGGWVPSHYLSSGAKLELLPHNLYLVTDVN
jgi:hypothetical protein